MQLPASAPQSWKRLSSKTKNAGLVGNPLEDLLWCDFFRINRPPEAVVFHQLSPTHFQELSPTFSPSFTHPPVAVERGGVPSTTPRRGWDGIPGGEGDGHRSDHSALVGRREDSRHSTIDRCGPEHRPADRADRGQGGYRTGDTVAGRGQAPSNPSAHGPARSGCCGQRVGATAEAANRADPRLVGQGPPAVEQSPRVAWPRGTGDLL